MIKTWEELEESISDSSLSTEDVSDSLNEVMLIVSDFTEKMGQICDENFSASSKSTILSLRRALRYCLSLFRVTELRIYLQDRLIELGFLYHLSRIIITARTDAKCCSMASKLICNMGTSNEKCAKRILNDVKPSCIEGALSNTMYGNQKSSLTDFDVNWNDMIYCTGSSGNRNALAAVVASIYNCICSLEDDSSSRKYICGIAGDVILMCNLVRYILPCSVVHNNKDEFMKDHSDSVTEWIQMLLEKLSEMGLFRSMFKSLGSQSDASLLRISPEQIILLHCIAKSVNEYSQSIHTSHAMKLHPLAGACSHNDRKEHFNFLANEWMKLDSHRDAKTIEDAEERMSYEGENELMKEASTLILEIISDAICADNDAARKPRCGIWECDGIKSMLRAVIMDLGKQVDNMCLENRGVNARELKLTNDEQNQITNFVRFIGNVCYQSKMNQDIVRDTLVPFPRLKLDNIPDCDPLLSDGLMTQEHRNGLHILLSCTSYAHGCFTLREWVIVAIRNVLEDNPLNQQIVSDLEAKQVLNSPELQRAGIQVELDERGNVKVIPGDKSL